MADKRVAHGSMNIQNHTQVQNTLLIPGGKLFNNSGHALCAQLKIRLFYHVRQCSAEHNLA